MHRLAVNAGKCHQGLSFGVLSKEDGIGAV
jgi:hypothetical protein